MMKRSYIQQREKGQSLVELAMVLVFVLILLAGVVDLGRMMYEYLTMRDAAQEGAAYGVVFPSYCVEMGNRVWANLPENFSLAKGDAVYVTVNGVDCANAYSVDKGLLMPQNACAGHEVIVNVDHKFEVGMPFLSMFTGPTIPIHVEIKDRIARPTCKS